MSNTAVMTLVLSSTSGRYARGSRGYYFISNTGQLCGLCAGMKVRLR